VYRLYLPFLGGTLNRFTQSSQEPYRILIVDDAPAVRESLGWLLVDEPGLTVVGDALMEQKYSSGPNCTRTCHPRY
jgi:hypothetical protein